MTILKMNQKREEKYRVAVSAESEQVVLKLMKHLGCSPKKSQVSQQHGTQYKGSLNLDGKHELEIVGTKAGNYLNLNSKNKTHYGLLVVIDCLTVSSLGELKRLLRPFLVYLQSYSCVIGLVSASENTKKSLSLLLQSIDVAVPVFELDYNQNNALIFLEKLLHLNIPNTDSKR